jgi:hypothetical protein
MISLCDPLTAHWPSEITPTKVWTGAAAFAGAFCGSCCEGVFCNAKLQTDNTRTTSTALNTEYLFIPYLL